MDSVDVVVIGGGIVGLATADNLGQRHAGLRVAVLEKESTVAAHQTGRNSGVLHSGMYYKPGSLKARNCVAGRQAMVEFCAAEGIAHDVCGKVIVAVDEHELAALDRIHQRGIANGVACEIIDSVRLAELEPHCVGIRAIHVPEAGIVDYRGVCLRLAERIKARGGQLLFGAAVRQLVHDNGAVVVASTEGELSARWVVNCTGLHSDRVTALSGQRPNVKIVPFRGEYYELKPAARHLVRNLIYPVPDARFPFLGLHFTRMFDGRIECGPNAVLALAREGYRWRDVNVRDLAESLSYPGFLRLAGRHFRMGMTEVWRSLSKRAFLKGLKRMIPEIAPQDLEIAPSGVRAQALDRSGNLVDDFLIVDHGPVVNVCNAPSPAATSALTIGESIVSRLADQFPG